MLNQIVTKKAISLLGKKSWIKYSPALSYKNFVNITYNNIERKIEEDNFQFSRFEEKKFKGKIGYKFASACDELIAKKLNDNIRRLFKIKPSDRHAIIKQTISLLKDSQPITIARLDIKNFYETIDRKKLVQYVINEWLLSHQSRIFLENWDKQLNEQNIEGLPRGMSLSSTLSEIRIRNFDKIMKYEKKVYFYARYVDDIIIFFTGNEDELKNITKKNLKETVEELSFNEDKCIFIYLGDKFKTQQNPEIDYLGYRIVFEREPHKVTEKRKIKVFISHKKIKKIKSRIRKSFTAYTRDRNFQLLVHRLKFLSGNQYIIGDIDRTKLKSGIYYNYPLITELEQLAELDSFYKKLLTCKSNKTILKALTMINNHVGLGDNSRKNQINSISFQFGFKKRVMNHFSTTISKKIKRCWL